MEQGLCHFTGSLAPGVRSFSKTMVFPEARGGETQHSVWKGIDKAAMGEGGIRDETQNG